MIITKKETTVRIDIAEIVGGKEKIRNWRAEAQFSIRKRSVPGGRWRPREKKYSRRRNYGTKISRPEGITSSRKGVVVVGCGGVYVAQVNRRIRSGVDGLVAAMAHLWSKFTKCLRASEGAYNPGVVLATPFEPRIPRRGSERDGTMLRHSVLLHRRYHHLAEPTTAPRIHLSFPIFLLLFFLLYFSTWLGRMLVLLHRNEISLSATNGNFQRYTAKVCREISIRKKKK